MYSYGGECLSFSRIEMWRIVMCGHRRECLVCLLLLSNINVASYPVPFRSARENVRRNVGSFDHQHWITFQHRKKNLGEMLDRLTRAIVFVCLFSTKKSARHF